MGYGYASACGPGSCGPAVARRYWSRDERKAWLQDYAEALESELKGVKERIQELEGAREV